MCNLCPVIDDELMLAEIDRELMLAEADAGVGVPTATRALTEPERRAKVRFGDIDKLERDAEAEAQGSIDKLFGVIEGELMAELFGDADAVAPADLAKTLTGLLAVQSTTVSKSVDNTSAELADLLNRVYAGSSAIVLDEAKRQGVDVGKLKPKAAPPAPDVKLAGGGFFDALAGAVASSLWQRVTGALQKNLLTPATLLAGAVKREDAAKVIADAGTAGAVDEATQAIHSARGKGRYDTAEELDPEDIWASELLDGATCDACAKVDGKEYATLAEARVEYETGGYGACKGGARCRGTLVMIYGSAKPQLPPEPPTLPVLPDAPTPAPTSTRNPAAPWSKAAERAKQALPKDPKELYNLGVKESVPDVKAFAAREKAKVIADYGADLPELKKRHADIREKLDDWDELTNRLRYSSGGAIPADAKPLAKKLGFGRLGAKSVATLLKDGRHDLWEMELDALSSVRQFETAMLRVEADVKRYAGKKLFVDDVLPDGSLGEAPAKALDAVLEAGAAVDEELSARVAKRLASMPDPYVEYNAISDKLAEIASVRAATPDDELFYKLGDEMRKLEADRAVIVYKVKDYDLAKSAIMREETAALLGDIRGVGGGARSTYVRGPGWNKEVDDAMSTAHSLYPDGWNDKVAAMFPNVRLSEVQRGYNAGGTEITLSRDRRHRGTGEFGHVAVHELGHSMELAIPGLQQLEWAFHHRRSDKIKRADGTVELKPAFDLYGGATGKLELAHKDAWSEEYTGKTYRRGDQAGAHAQWEIFQTGVESLFEGSPYFKRSTSLGEDVEFRRFILGVLSVL